MNSKPKSTGVKPYAGLAVGILAVSTSAVFIRFAQNDASSMAVAAWRLTFAALILTPIIFIKYRQEIRSISRKEIRVLLLAGIFLAFHFASWITSLELTTVTSSVVLVSTTPLWVALGSPIFLKESIPWKVYIGLLIALAGGFLVSLGDWHLLSDLDKLSSEFLKSENMMGNLLALLGAITGAGYMLVGRKVRDNIPLIPYIFVVYSISAAVLLLMSFGMHTSMTGFAPTTWLLFLALALFPQLIGHSSFNWALKYLPAAAVSITLLGEPIGAAVLAVIFLKEFPSPLELIGAILILIGVYYVSIIINQKPVNEK